jgi:hypothetical protein
MVVLSVVRVGCLAAFAIPVAARVPIFKAMFLKNKK